MNRFKIGDFIIHRWNSDMYTIDVVINDSVNSDQDGSWFKAKILESNSSNYPVGKIEHLRYEDDRIQLYPRYKTIKEVKDWLDE